MPSVIPHQFPSKDDQIRRMRLANLVSAMPPIFKRPCTGQPKLPGAGLFSSYNQLNCQVI